MGKKNQRQKGQTVDLASFNPDANKSEDNSWALDTHNPQQPAETSTEPRKKKEKYISIIPDFRNCVEQQPEFVETPKDISEKSNNSPSIVTKEKNGFDRNIFGTQQNIVTPDRSTLSLTLQEPKIAPKYKAPTNSIDRTSFGVSRTETPQTKMSDTKIVSRKLFGTSKPSL
jgi:hypothetical protein